jgi:hypothetical protein
VADKQVLGSNELFTTANYTIIGKTVYQFCFFSPTESCNFYFNKKNSFLFGISTGGAYGGTLVTGVLYDGNWFLANDHPTGSGSPVETVVYWGAGKKSYLYLDSSGVNGTGKLSACTTSSEEDFSSADSLVPTKAKIYCLEDQWGNQYNLEITGGIFIRGLANNISCGTCEITGFLMGKSFAFYVDIPTGTSSCTTEGYLVVCDLKTKSGLWQNTNDTGSGEIFLSKCSPNPTGIPAIPGPGENPF